MHTRTLPLALLVALSLVLVAVPLAPQATAAPAECHGNPDGSLTCDARTLGCFTHLTIHPDGSVDGWVLAC